MTTGILPTTELIGRRVKAMRAARNLSQGELARRFGFKDRQTVSAIENGVRRVKAEELAFLAETFDAPIDYFTDPFSLAGEGRFCWREQGVETATLEAFEHRAGCWIAAYRVLAPKVGCDLPLMRRGLLGLTRHSSADDAIRAGERFAAEFDLGDVPAARLADVMQRELGILVLVVEAEDGISGAACRLAELDAVLVARDELPGRRHFDLAHELFHLLTWDAMPPAWSEAEVRPRSQRVERLANSFASALLAPERALNRFAGWSDLDTASLASRLNDAAEELHVTSSALRWRLVALGDLDAEHAAALPGTLLHNNGRDTKAPPPPLFSRRFADVVCRALDRGLVSVRRLALLLDLDADGLDAFLESHGLRPQTGLL